MREFTLTVMLALATLAVDAKNAATPTWTKSLTTTEKAEDINRGGAMAIDADGNSIVTGSYTKDLEFANSYLESTATSAFIAKYDKAGKELWAAGLSGAATITTVTTDTEGNIYAAGVFADNVNILDAQGDTKATITGMANQTSQVSGFIVKYNKDGEYVVSKVVVPNITCTDETYFMPEPYFKPKKIEICGDNIIISASYQASSQIDELVLEGQYGYQDWGYTFDVPTFGIISLSNDFEKASLVAQLSSTDKQTTVGYGAEDVNFATDGSKVYAGFVAYGSDLTLRSANGSKQIKDLLSETSGEETKYEHAFVLATIEGGNITDTKIYHSKIDDNLKEAKFNSIDEMAFQNGDLFLAGTFNETFPFDNSKAYKGGCDTYLACLNANDLSKSWALTSGYNEGDANKNAESVSGMAIYDDQVQLTGWSEATSGHKVISPLNFSVALGGTPSIMSIKDSDDATFITSVAQNGQNTLTQSDNKQVDGTEEGTYTYSFFADGYKPTAIKQVLAGGNAINIDGNTVCLAKAANVDLYSANGVLVKSAKNVSTMSLDNLANGVYVIKVGEQTVKFVK